MSIADDIKVYHNPADDLSEANPNTYEVHTEPGSVNYVPNPPGDIERREVREFRHAPGVGYVETDHTVKPIIPVDYARIEKRIEEYVRSKQATITDMLYRGGKPGEPYARSESWQAKRYLTREEVTRMYTDDEWFEAKLRDDVTRIEKE
jgi:hypothetical protein